MYAYQWEVASDDVARSSEYVNILGLKGEIHLTRQELSDRVHPDDRTKFLAAVADVTPENPITHLIYRVLLDSGDVIWLENSGRAFFDQQGRMLRMIGMVADVTERKHAEEALSSVRGRLIEAQEQERLRIARELHDDLSQRTALLQIALEQFEQETPRLSSKARQQLHRIAEIVLEVSAEIHNLSHQLHPSKLDILGLVRSLESLCREFSEQHDLRVQFAHHDIPGQIPKEVTLCLFRIVQEALRNVVTHSGATEAKVEVSRQGNRIELCISDAGTGFDAGSAQRKPGLGLISMRERLALVGGHLSVRSELLHGTQIRAHVPLAATNSGVAGKEKAHKAGI